jgi:hypothetical protein
MCHVDLRGKEEKDPSMQTRASCQAVQFYKVMGVSLGWVGPLKCNVFGRKRGEKKKKKRGKKNLEGKETKIDNAGQG